KIKCVGKEEFIRKHQMPTPRVHFSTSLNHINRIVLNDISDGIANELREIAEESQVNIIIDDRHIPVHSNFYQFTEKQQYEWKYFGGEDFELVGTASEKDWCQIQEVAEKLKLRITKIGMVTYDKSLVGQVYLKKDNQLHILQKLGYSHLK